MVPEIESKEIGEIKSSVWGKDTYGGIEYDRLGEFPPKKLLDRRIAEYIIEISRDSMGFENGESIKVAELFAARAPISRTLKEMNQLNFECHAFDNNEDMKGNNPLDWLDSYNTDFDASEISIEEHEKEKFDWVIIENGLYATSISEDGTRKYTKREAEILRTIALQKAMSMLKPGGFLIISDALDKTSNFGLKRIMTFLQKDVEARRVLKEDEKGKTRIIWKYITEHLMKSVNGNKRASMIDVLKRNREFVAKAQLFTHEENLDLFRRLGLNERILISQANDYLGSNGTYILRKLSDIETQDHLPNQLGEPIALKYPIHEKLLELIGRFRRDIYKKTKQTNNLPIIDEFDRKEDGMTLVYPQKNHIGLIAAATIQPKDSEIGLDAEGLMIPENNSGFYNALLEYIYKDSKKVQKAIDKEHKIRFGEVRRLAADSLLDSEIEIFIGDLWRRFTSYSRKRGIDIVLFVSDEKRLKLFNYFNKNGGTQFRKVEGFDLDRKNEDLQTMMISASNYFFGEWENLVKNQFVNEKDVENINKLQNAFTNGDNWRTIVNQLEDPENIIASVEKLLKNAPSNVNLYYTDHAMPNLD